MVVWNNGTFQEEAGKIDSLNFSLHYANPVVWEGIRSYLQEDGTTKIWKLKEHIERLFDSAKIIGVEIPHVISDVISACEQVVEKNGGGDLYLRPVVYSKNDAESVMPQPTNIALDIYCFPIPQLHKTKEIKMGISNITRGYPQFQMQAKTAANYSVIQLAKSQMEIMKVDDMFFTDNQGYIVEATVANFFVIKGNVVMTPPNRGSILPGITRRTIAELLMNSALMFVKHKKAPLVIEKDITKADLYTADCVILCGTYAEVVNVLEIDGRKIGSPETHEYFHLIRDEYQKLVRGKG